MLFTEYRGCRKATTHISGFPITSKPSFLSSAANLKTAKNKLMYTILNVLGILSISIYSHFHHRDPRWSDWSAWSTSGNSRSSIKSSRPMLTDEKLLSQNLNVRIQNDWRTFRSKPIFMWIQADWSNSFRNFQHWLSIFIL